MNTKYPLYQLTEAEYSVVDKYAHETRCDESWFSIAGCYKDGNGKVRHVRGDKDGDNDKWKFDCVYDMENNRFITLHRGLTELFEAYGGDVSDLLDKGEVKVYNALVEKLNKGLI